MSNFQEQFPGDSDWDGGAAGGKPRTSGFAIASLATAILGCCPFVWVLSPVFGGVALATISRNPMLRGRGLAIAGILISLLLMGVRNGASIWAERWVAEQVEAPLDGAFAGDPAAVRPALLDGAPDLTDAEIRAFAAAVRAAHGDYQSAELAGESTEIEPVPGEPILPLGINVTFASGDVVPGTVIFQIMDQSTGSFAPGVTAIILHSPGGDIELRVEGAAGQAEEAAGASAEDAAEAAGDAIDAAAEAGADAAEAAGEALEGAAEQAGEAARRVGGEIPPPPPPIGGDGGDGGSGGAGGGG